MSEEIEEKSLIKFTTSQGSEYIFNPDIQKSKRTKKSGGSNQGKTFPYLSVVFIEDRSKVRLYNPRFNVKVGLFTDTGMFKQFNDVPKIINENEKLVVIEFDKDNMTRPLNIQKAFLNPKVDLFPLEWGNNIKGQPIKHLGNKIIEVEE